MGLDGNRKTLRIGKMTKRAADSAKLHVEDLLACKTSGTSPRLATSQWVAGLSDTMHKRLAKLELVTPRVRQTVPTLAEWLETYIGSRTDVKPNTLRNYEQVQGNMLRYFSKSALLDEITPANAEGFRIYLKMDRKLGEGTVSRQCKRARQFFTAAIDERLITENPFARVRCGNFAEDRFHFITPADAQRVLDACPDVEWRLIFALARYGGLRVPSELLQLKWGNIDWERQRFTVTSVKTAHHSGKGSRTVPTFPELAPFLRDAFELADEGTEHIITRYRETSQNLRTQLMRIVAKAGLDMWPKAFTNLRSSRETELVETFPLHVVVGWLGNSPDVAKRHYLQTTQDHYERAVTETSKSNSKALQKALQSTAAKACNQSQRVRKTRFMHSLQPIASHDTHSIPPRGLEPLSSG